MINVQIIAKGNNRAAKLVQGNNAFMGLLEIAPGFKVPLHKDVTEEYLYFLSGGGNITINGETFIVQTGSTVYMPRLAEVSYTNGDTSTRLIQVFAGPEPSEKYKSWTETTFKW